ncbi:MAG: hypothetical protein EOP39_06125 [Rubrivivax sp.]|nr:MAG: hypothetical protein EOP39_06125 [Rubrivivax sp.]
MTVCAKCRHLRPVDSAAPAWQCPGCGIAYDKVLLDVERNGVDRPSRTVRTRSSLPWRALLIVGAVAAGLWWGHQSDVGKRGLFGGLASVHHEARSQPQA